MHLCDLLQQNATVSTSKNGRKENLRSQGKGIGASENSGRKMRKEYRLAASVSSPKTWDSSRLSLMVMCKKKKKKYQKFLTQCLVLNTVNFNIFKKLLSCPYSYFLAYPKTMDRGAWWAICSPRQSDTIERLSASTPQNILGVNFVLVFLERIY